MKKHNNLLYSLLGICCGSLFWSCSAISHADKDLIQQRMQDYLEKETGKTFVLENLEYVVNYQHGNVGGYRGTFHQTGDKRLAISLYTSELDNYTNLLHPEKDLEKFSILSRTVAISDQVKEIAQAFFHPQYVHTHAWTQAVNFDIKIYLQDDITPQNMAAYMAFMKKITSQINTDIAEIEDNYFEVNLHIFTQSFELPAYDAVNGAIDWNGPKGDYIIKAKIDAHKNVVLHSQLGFGAKLDKTIRQKIAQQYNLQDPNRIHHEFHPHRDKYPEDLDENGVRHFSRYMVPVYNQQTNKVIRRDYIKVNIFSQEMTTFQPPLP